MLNDRQKIDLDNYITGHWGEDQFKDDDREVCDKCSAELEEGQIGLCDDCQDTGKTFECPDCEGTRKIMIDAHGTERCEDCDTVLNATEDNEV